MHKKFLGKSVTPERKKKKKRQRPQIWALRIFAESRYMGKERGDRSRGFQERGTKKSEEIIGRRGRLLPTDTIVVLLCVVTFPS